MSLTKKDFDLTDHQVALINQHFAKRVSDYVAAGEDPPGSIKVVFEWMPPLGRGVTAYFDGEIEGHSIE